MKKKKIYLVLAILTTLVLFSTAALCNWCVSPLEEEIIEEAEREAGEETTEAVEEATEEESSEDEEEETAEEEPTEEPEYTDEYKDWKTYINDIYSYEFYYPERAEISEADRSSFGIPTEDYEKGITFDDVYNKYTGKICITIRYKSGYITISAPENIFVECGRTGVGSEYEVTELEEKLVIDGKDCIARGVELQSGGETLDRHQEFLRLRMEDGTAIEYGSISDDVATYEDYLEVKETLIKIIESYRKVAID